jgi:hypothetical protein
MPDQAGDLPWVAVAKGKKSFVFEPSGKPFIPWGFNHDHDAVGLEGDELHGMIFFHQGDESGFVAGRAAKRPLPRRK